ncbi:hypothetical protein VNI00_014447 [Paramarasmius palmivorus]|uniref:BTB domain-containing protein n=1 Tax=Paramarasmius palmivorus TaxID=297713 RepID=A0AAW0BQN2_9AGAR
MLSAANPMSVSQNFGPDVQGSGRPEANMILLSKDSVTFYVNEYSLLRYSNNNFNGLLPFHSEYREGRMIFLRHLPSAELDILLQSIYGDVPQSRVDGSDIESLRLLTRGIGWLPVFGIAPKSVILPDTHLFDRLLSHAPLYPLETYALAGHHDIYDLAVAASPHTLPVDLSNVGEELALQMSSKYLLQLFNLHSNRRAMLSKLLSEELDHHDQTENCRLEDQRESKNRWNAAIESLVWDVNANTSINLIRERIFAHTSDITCDECIKARDARLNTILTEWTSSACESERPVVNCLFLNAVPGYALRARSATYKLQYDREALINRRGERGKPVSLLLGSPVWPPLAAFPLSHRLDMWEYAHKAPNRRDGMKPAPRKDNGSHAWYDRERSGDLTGADLSQFLFIFDFNDSSLLMLRYRYHTSFDTRVPNELAAKTLAERESFDWDTPRLPRISNPIPLNDDPTRPSMPPQSTARVQFYSHLSKIQRNLLPDFEASVELDEYQRLHTDRVARMWGLESCVPVDPEKCLPMYDLVERKTRGIIEFPWVRKLQGDKGSIMFIELEPPSKSISQRRAYRESKMKFFQALSIFYKLVKGILLDASADLARFYYHRTPFPLCYRDMKRLCRFIFLGTITSYSWMNTTGKDLAVRHSREVAQFLRDLVMFTMAWFEFKLVMVYYHRVVGFYTDSGIEDRIHAVMRRVGLGEYQHLTSAILVFIVTIFVLLLWLFLPVR